MAVQVLDTSGQKRPKPVLNLSIKAPDMRPGDVLEVWGDGPTFEKDVRTWCDRLGKIFLSVKNEKGDQKKIQIRF
jgi:tRNA 2-thiouridine synthesizing protein A